MFGPSALSHGLQRESGPSGDAASSVRAGIYGLRLVANAGLNPAGGFGSTTDRSFYHNGGQNNVRSVADWSGTQVAGYTYDAWGSVRWQTGSATNLFGYDGQQQDFTSGLFFLRARYYDAASGRFTQQDPAEDGGNWYVYAGNSPVNATDPCGLWCAGHPNWWQPVWYIYFSNYDLNHMPKAWALAGIIGGMIATGFGAAVGGAVALSGPWIVATVGAALQLEWGLTGIAALTGGSFIIVISLIPAVSFGFPVWHVGSSYFCRHEPIPGWLVWAWTEYLPTQILWPKKAKAS